MADGESDTRRRLRVQNEHLEGEVQQLQDRVAALATDLNSLRRSMDVREQLRMRLASLNEKMSFVTALGRDINVLEDLDAIMDVAIQRVPALVDARYASLFLYDGDRKVLALQRHNHPGEINNRVAVPRHPDTIMGIALERKECLVIRDLQQFEQEHERTTGRKLERTFAEKYMTTSCIAAPLLSGNEIVGVLNLADRDDGDCFDDKESLPPVEQISHLLGARIRNCQLFQEIQTQARTDSLTQLVNHRNFYDQLRRELHRAIRYGRTLSLLMMDVDRFKQVNDGWGHPKGDEVLVRISEVIRSSIRKEDIAARYGGDEFAAILPETPEAGARMVAERLTLMVHGEGFGISENGDVVGLSVGVAELDPAMNLNDFVRAADDALYEAKRQGKGRVVVAPRKPS